MITTEYPVINLQATGERIRELREQNGFSVREVSEYMGFTEPQAVYKWQRGQCLPTVDNLLALSRIFHTSIEDILIGDDEMSSHFFSFLCTRRSQCGGNSTCRSQCERNCTRRSRRRTLRDL